jgi:ABC-2 type transport system permease protein
VNVFPVLLRRELWEHRALWVAPLVVAVLLLFATMSGHGTVDLPEKIDGSLSRDQKLALFALTQWALTIPQYLVMLIVLFFYLLDCLYAERKDRSILFWKSLPVSDAATVLSKLAVALLLVPLGVYLLALVTDVLFSGVLRLRLRDSSLGEALLTWDTGVWLRVQAIMFIGLIVAMLWYAPIAAYLLLVSAWARRNVFLWAVLPPVLLLMVEEIATNTDYVKNFIGYRLSGIWSELGIGQGLDRLEVTLSDDEIPAVHRLLDTIDASAAFGSIDLWLGVAAAAALVWGAVRIRRYRDDT